MELKKAAHFILSSYNLFLVENFFVSDIAAETTKLVSGLTGKVSFLRNLECLYDSFGIGCTYDRRGKLSLQDAVCNVSSVNAYIKNTVAEVRQHYKMKETATINGTEGTVSRKTQESLVLLERGMEQLRDNVKNVNEDYLGDIDLRTLLTTQVRTFMQSPTSKTRLSPLFSMLKTLEQFQRNL